MTRKNKSISILKSFLRYYLIWLIAMMLFNLIRRVGTVEVLNGGNIVPPDLYTTLRMLFSIPVVLALLSVLSDNVLSIKRTLHMSYGRVILLHIGMDLIMLILTTMFVYRQFHLFGLEAFSADENIFQAVFSRNMIIAGTYITFVNLIISISRLINANMGQGNLWKLITGKYHQPKEEEYIFMFLDLKSSTTAAEQIGHYKYSQMIQECYFDLAMPLQDTEGQVYQFVGDEAVIMWDPSKKGYDTRWLTLFYGFDKILSDKRENYQTKYGWEPQFKAGVHKGKVIATQVGALKREIAFHGDTMNITARIQSLCNQKGVKILVSDELKKATRQPSENTYEFLEQGEEILKGKAQKMKIYSVNPI